MLSEKSIQKPKKFFLKTLRTLKKFLFEGYDKIPRNLPLNPLSCSSINHRNHQLDHIYSHFSNQSIPNHDQDNANHLIMKPNVSSKKVIITNISDANKIKKEVIPQRKIEPSSSSFSSSRSIKGGNYFLAQKMKELEMIDHMGDIDHDLDVEEALHYYSRLSCPAYVDIVDEFFMDMYVEFRHPQTLITRSTSSRRLRPLKLH